MTDEGVTWEVPQDHQRGTGSERDIPVGHAFRVEADQMIGFSLKDFRAEVLSPESVERC